MKTYLSLLRNQQLIPKSQAMVPASATAKNEYPVGRKKMYVVLFFANILLTIFRLIIVSEASVEFHIGSSIASLFGFLGIWEFILAFGNLLEKKFPLDIHTNKRIIIQIIATYLIATIIGDTIFLTAVNVFHVPLPGALKTFGYLLYFLLSIVLNLIYFGTIYFFHWKKDLVNLANMQREQAIVKYDALKNQLNPHFLFNALTSLNSLIFENQQLASDFLQQLSKVYRYVLQHKEKETVSINTELEFIKHYIFLLKTRFDDAITFHLDLKEEIKTKEIVPVTLQILIENAIKHNIVSLSNPLQISITADTEYLIVRNNLNRKDQVESSNRQGLENIKAFYRFLSALPIQILEAENSYTVKIPLI
jgi:hypothetical protein